MFLECMLWNLDGRLKEEVMIFKDIIESDIEPNMIRVLYMLELFLRNMWSRKKAFLKLESMWKHDYQSALEVYMVGDTRFDCWHGLS